VLEMRGVYKAFPGVMALTDVDFRVYAGEIHALVGENGAGKSTLMKVLAGIHPINQGEILLDGNPVRFRSPLESRAAGVSLIHQELNLVPNMTVAENIFLGAELRQGWFVNHRQMNQTALFILEQLGAEIDPNTRVGELSLAQGQLVEIARALAHRGRVLVMDEPTSALSERETEHLFEVICQLRREGVAIVYISHRINEVYALADRVTVLRDGECIGTLSGEDIGSEAVVRMMAGRDPAHVTTPALEPRLAARQGASQVVLEVRDLGDGRRLKPANLRVSSGEILGLTGLVGSGRSTLARVICGADRGVTGEILIDGQVRRIRSPADALRAGIAYLPENRKEQALFLEMSAQDNLVISVLRQYTRIGVNDESALGQLFWRNAQRFGITVRSPRDNVSDLSGGNQQKLLLARSLVAEPKVLILDEPTRGIDVTSRAELYQLMLEVASRGTAIIVISTDLTEILELSHRVLVMREGEIVAELERSELNQETILAFATGLRRS
jgi:ribose transport system ATP-binding protein